MKSKAYWRGERMEHSPAIYDQDAHAAVSVSARRPQLREPSYPAGRARIGAVAAFVMLLSSVGAVQLASPSSPVAAAPIDTLTLDVISARTEPRAFGGTGVTEGDAIASFQFMINVDETGTTETQRPENGYGDGGCWTSDANYPNDCLWQSISEPSGWAPIYAQGNQADLAALGPIPEGRYLISLLADGYKIDGAHFCIETSGSSAVPGCTEPLSGPLTVEMQPNPLPDGTLRAQVFEDNAPTNMGYDNSEAPLAGFVGHITDTLGEVQTDVYGNPLCTRYEGENPDTYEIPFASLDADMLPIPVPGTGGNCYSDATGMLAIPHLGSNRYAVFVTPPDGQSWIQTTTLEGNHDYDAWIFEGDTGYSTIFARGGEPTPDPIFGFVRPLKNGQRLSTSANDQGHIKGVVVAIKTYTPPIGGAFNFWGGNVGTKVGKPIDRPWLSLQDLQAGDAAVWIGRGNVDGSFDISGVPDGNYNLSWWDEPQDYNLNMINITVSNGETVEMGQLPLNGWWTEYEGYVFSDTNRNGVKDPGEPGVPNYTLTIRHRENNLYDRGQNTATTDDNGYYYFESGYPIGEWTVLEAYSDSFYTTGVTFQTDNQPTPTTIKGAGVDVSTMPIIGLGGRIDWGVHAYDAVGSTGGVDPRNGGIVGTVSYDTTRNELDPRYAATEDWQPGISGVPVYLYAPVACTNPATQSCDAAENYQLASDGSYAKGQLLNSYLTESWERPTGCTARDVDGNPLVHGVDENVLVPNQETTGECISSFMQGIQFATYPTDQGTPDANFGASVNGNYGFGDGCFAPNELDTSAGVDAAVCRDTVGDPVDFVTLPADDYLVSLDFPKDATGKPMYKATREEDINVGNGDQVIPQVPPPACAGALHTVDVVGIGPEDAYDAIVGTGYGPGGNGIAIGVTVPASTPTVNDTFADIEGSPFDGQAKPLCDTKLVELANGKSIAPLFNVFTDVPIPARMRTVIIDDLNFSNDPRSVMYGEKAGMAFAPVGIYDFANKLVYTTETDFNGIYDVLLPSTNHISCPTPSGVCGNMYRFVANDPGIPGRLNPNYNPRFATHAAGAEGLPGISTFADLAPTQVGLTIESPSTGVVPVTCPQDGATPQLFAVSQPYVNGSGSFTINGLGFGAGPGVVALDDSIVLTADSWSDTQINVSVPVGTAVGPHQLEVTSANGQRTVNGLTFHVLGAGYQPNLYEVGPGRPYAAIQDALDAAFASTGDDLVVVYPGTPDPSNPRNNPTGAYYENLIMASPVKLQGVGPGGFQPGGYVTGSIINGSAFGGDTPAAVEWFNKVATYTWDGNQNINDAEVIYILASQRATTANGRARQFTEAYKASIDGFDLRGGIQNGFPTNINDLTGGNTGLPATIETQGGAIFANSYVRHLQITNNVVQNNGGAYGTIRIGTPDIPPLDPTDQAAGGSANNHNEDIRIADNRIIANAGTSLAGGIGLFVGSDRYEVANNDICGNFSLEYGGGLTVYGRSPGGKIHHNRIYYNMSNDEGGGIMMAGELPTNPNRLSPGTGSVDIYANEIQANMSNDDGGGIRFLMAGGPGGVDQMNIYNNMIVNNISTHEGGGIGINDAPNVRVFNNTIMKNMTTATAVTSDGTPRPAGLSTSANSDLLQVTLPAGSPTFSNPLLFNNIFWDNRAGTRAGTTVTGIGLAGDANPINLWDLGVADETGVLTPTNSVIQQNPADHPYTTDASNSAADPAVVSTYDLSVRFATWRQNAAFVDATLVGLDLPLQLLSDYHLTSTSPAIDTGAASKGGVDAPATDFDDELRPAGVTFDMGADEFGAAGPPPPPPPPPPASMNLYFSTAGNVNPPGISEPPPPDDSDIYLWNNSQFSRVIDATAGPCVVPSWVNVDAFDRVDATHYYISFNNYYSSGFGSLGRVYDEDVLFCNAGTWEMFYDGSLHGLGGSADVDAITVVGGRTLYFSTERNDNLPGVGSGDDADVYSWVRPLEVDDVDNYTRVFDASANGLPGSADIDGLEWVGATHLYASFLSATTTVPVIGAVQNEDVVEFLNGTWSVYFDGTAAGLTGSNGALNIDALSIKTSTTPPPTQASQSITFGALANKTFGDADFNVGATASSGLAVSFAATGNCTVAGTLVHLLGVGSCTITASQAGNAGFLPAASVDQSFTIAAPAGPVAPTITFDPAPTAQYPGADFVVHATTNSDGALSYSVVSGPCTLVDGAAGSITPTGTGDCVVQAATAATAGFLAGSVQQTVAIGSTPPPPVTPNVEFSTLGNVAVGALPNPDDSDIYLWDGSQFSTAIDASVGPCPTPAWVDVDGFARVDATHYYISFNNYYSDGFGSLGRVYDEDVLFCNAGTWELFFDGSTYGLGGSSGSTSFDLDAISVVGGSLYFSTDNSNNPPGAGGSGDDADIYRWNGDGTYTRVFDASAAGLPAGANVDGLDFVDATHFYVTFAGTSTATPGIGNIADVDIAYFNSGTWSLVFVGSEHGLAAGTDQDLDAIDVVQP